MVVEGTYQSALTLPSPTRRGLLVPQETKFGETRIA